MKAVFKGLGVAALAAACVAPAFAQNAVVASAGGVPITSGTGVSVTPGMSRVVASGPSTVTVTEANAAAMGAAPGSTVRVTHYWVNVPADANSRPDFQRWQQLK